MRMEHLKNLPVGRLQYVFDPCGLPVVAKSENSPGTTSILVRGTAGSGKSTLATALALALAKRADGTVLFLSTETSPTDIAYKADLLGFGEVYPITQQNDAGPGTILAHHLAMARDEIQDRRSDALDVVWQAVEKTTTVPIRAVVIDAFGQPFSDSDMRLREQTAALIHSLEQLGISVVFIEEGVETVWLSYVVDVVFRLEFEEGVYQNRRSLHVSKCRYAQSVPGPHPYTLMGGKLEVWPDLLTSAATNKSEKNIVWQPVLFARETIELRKLVLFGPGNAAILHNFSMPAPIRTISIFWGPQIRMVAKEEGVEVFVEETDLSKLGWMIYEESSKNVETVFILWHAPIHQLRSDSNIGLSRLLMAIHLLGISFWVVDQDRLFPPWLRGLVGVELG